ncbi:hypothetical protein BCR41DRAFT_395898 [Lobosporangium transversale]|uniref:Uncharacterized protein n=1 Tax=Lobosporangium transversale TaxID=64571 RepID=A0A1Y2GQK9_9FUNG|nr:hypothetical protein BCR41DRAFT_402786 [Lobosporangium transversale]XP_021881551.1 hypothetical protein BCR41DRAFT_395898 [Lobosporangium transversale]ORY88688.1 hypothetical protein BCR41DRAFT_402786 [Lobosporangium transversale]ORZ16616.1 hypothetical protein BCR41DRAFT_395898 [Lobosporangium transversale]|eukprot:XP_021875002.1 hypothetical protein BCR41DRAFT_402786 [Lobosporangium transversale]
MEEESRRRHAPQFSNLHPVDALNTTSRQRQAFIDDEAVISKLNNAQIDINNVQEESNVKERVDEQKAQELKLLLQQQQQEYQKAQGEIAAEHHQKYLKQQQQAGHSIPAQQQPHAVRGNNQVGPSGSKPHPTISNSTSTSTASSASTTSTTRRRRAGFELNINHATLLNRRAKQQQHPSMMLDQQQQQESPAMAI